MSWTSGHGVEFSAVESGLYFLSTPFSAHLVMGSRHVTQSKGAVVPKSSSVKIPKILWFYFRNVTHFPSEVTFDYSKRHCVT